MVAGAFRFEGFLLETAERRLTRNSVPVPLNGRYLDALALLVHEAGKLVSKDRFLEEVWRGIPVTDEALTQCIRTLRRQLGDEAAEPRFIQTVPKHGYRFVAPVERVEGEHERTEALAGGPSPAWNRKEVLQLSVAGSLGGAAAGLIGGLAYGFAAASQPLQQNTGAISVLLVLTCITLILATTGAAGVACGIAFAGFGERRAWYWPSLGGAAGGLIVGAAVKLLGTDAFSLLVGRSPGDITGAAEGALLGGAVGLGAWLGSRGSRPSLRRAAALAGCAGALAGTLISLLGARLLGGSLDLLVRQFPDSRVRLDAIGGLFGEAGFGPVSATVTSALEGLLFGACVVGAMIIGRRRLGEP